MKKLVIRKVETLKTTAALYNCDCWPDSIECAPWET